MTLAPLRDGTTIRIRDLRPGDRDRLLAGFAQLSPTARLLRFGHEIDVLTPSMLDALMDVDGHDHVALVAVEDAEDEGAGLGIARFIREPFDTHAAEAAVTVAEGQRGRGIGTALLVALVARALREDVTELRNYVLAGNAEMLGIFHDLGARTSLDGGRVLRLDLPLTDRLPSDSTAASVLRAMASRT